MTRSSRNLRAVLFLITVLTFTFCEAQDDGQIMDEERTQKEFPQGIARLLFKHMRFRDLPEGSDEDGSDLQTFGPWQEQLSDHDVNMGDVAFFRKIRAPSQTHYLKREQQELLVNNLAALLADTTRGKNSASTLRMPSLRFG